MAGAGVDELLELGRVAGASVDELAGRVAGAGIEGLVEDRVGSAAI